MFIITESKTLSNPDVPWGKIKTESQTGSLSLHKDQTDVT